MREAKLFHFVSETDKYAAMANDAGEGCGAPPARLAGMALAKG